MRLIAIGIGVAVIGPSLSLSFPGIPSSFEHFSIYSRAGWLAYSSTPVLHILGYILALWLFHSFFSLLGLLFLF